jgi:hypothetical protein
MKYILLELIEEYPPSVNNYRDSTVIPMHAVYALNKIANPSGRIVYLSLKSPIRKK